jgi:penicillin-binding protein 1A
MQTREREGEDSSSDEPWALEANAGHLHRDPAPAPPRRWRRRLVRLATLAAALPVVGVALFAFLYARTKLPAMPVLPEDTRLLDRNGRTLALLSGGQDRDIVALRGIPMVTREAVIATEDADFYNHPGVDVGSVARAALADVRSGRLVQGGSTITQQLVKNLYTGNARTLSRKVDEGILALKLEREYTKDQILAKYLNTVYFGQGAYGIQAAAQTYFDQDASGLNAAQSALLAGLLAGPSRWDPREHPVAAAHRRSYVLRRMEDEGYLAPKRVRRLEDVGLSLAPHSDTWSEGGAAYFIDDTRRWLEARYGTEQTLAGGLRVTTTIDSQWQHAAEAAIRSSLPRGGPQGALVAIDPSSGAIRAMVGGSDFQRSPFNLATQAHRQPGSSFKPFGLIAAIQAGISPLERFDGPPELTLRQPPCGAPGAAWSVANYADEAAGTMNLFDATAESVNTIFAQLVQQVGPDSVAATAHELGISSKLDPVCSIVLGSEEVTPLELTSAYATIAADGVRHDPSPVERIADRRGGVIWSLDPRGEPALDPASAGIATKALQGVVESGTGTAAALEGRPVAGKTGTTQDYSNAWFCGYVPQLAACVWMGYPRANRPMAGVTGGSTPADIWHAFMSVATRGMDVVPFPPVDVSAFRPASSIAPSPPATLTPGVSGSPSDPSPGGSQGSVVAPTPSPTPGESPGPSSSPTNPDQSFGPSPSVAGIARRET